MKYVLDVNMSRSDELLQLLIQGNEIILNDDFFVEMFKARDAVAMLQKNSIHLREFPLSIFYAKTRGELTREEIARGKPVNEQDVISDEDTQKTRWFIGLDETEIEKYLPLFKREAEKRISESNLFSEQFIRNLSIKANELDVKKYKNNPEELEKDMFDSAMTVLEMTLMDKCETAFYIDDFKKQKSVLFLDSYILFWRIMDWVHKKGYSNAKNIVNDNFDLKYVLASCFFDGLLTKEKWMQDCRTSALSFYE